jgi:DHA1 family multidrug resistance protein-like MFS transporter
MEYYRRNLYILTFTNFLSASSWNQIVPFLPQFLRELNVQDGIEGWVGIIFSLNFVGGIVMQPLWGKIADMTGRKSMIVRAGLCLSFICFGMSFSTSPWQVAFFRFLNGALTGFMPGAIALIATNTPEELSGRYVAIAQTGGAAGNILGPALGGLLSTFMGFRVAMRVSGFVVLIATLLVLFLVKEEKKVEQIEKTSLSQDFIAAIKMPVLISVMGTVMLATTISMSIQPILTFYLEMLDPSVSKILSGSIFSLPGLAFVFFAYRWASLGERISYPKVILIALVGVSMSTAALSLSSTVWQFVIIYFIVGLFLAALTPCAATLIATGVDKAFRGRAYGMQQSASLMGGALAPTVSGLLGSAIGIKHTFSVMGSLVLLATGLLYLQMRTWVDFKPIRKPNS